MPGLPSTLHVMLLDDDPDDNYLFEEAVKQSTLDIRLSLATPTTFFKILQEENPDIILLDINMPVKDGMEYLKELRDNALYKNIPVIMYSTSKYKIEDSLSAGATYYFAKPNSFNDLKKLVHVLYNNQTGAEKSIAKKEFYLDISLHK